MASLDFQGHLKKIRYNLLFGITLGYTLPTTRVCHGLSPIRLRPYWAHIKNGKPFPTWIRRFKPAIAQTFSYDSVFNLKSSESCRLTAFIHFWKTMFYCEICSLSKRNFNIPSINRSLTWFSTSVFT